MTNELNSITGASGVWARESMGYNSLKQLTSLSSSGVENRLISLNGTSTAPVAFYSYDPSNKRVWRGNWVYTTAWSRTQDEITFWSISGRKLATYNLTQFGTTLYATQIGTNYYFGGKLIKNASGYVYSDRLGSIGGFFPYGQQRGYVPPNDTEKFTGYVRDAETGNDYAVSRYESPGTGRFLTPDRINGHTSDPGSWNRYAYVGGDPINHVDPSGTESVCTGPDDDPSCDEEYDYCTELYQEMTTNTDPDGWILYSANCGGNSGGGSSTDYAPQQSSPPQGAPSDQAVAQYAIVRSNLSAAVQLALSKLLVPSCASKLFNPNMVNLPNPSLVLISLWNGYMPGSLLPFYGSIGIGGNLPADTDAGTQVFVDGPGEDAQGFGTGVAAVLISINPSSDFLKFGASPSASQMNYLAAVILHELGHAYSDLFGPNSTSITHDSVGDDGSIANQTFVLQNCFGGQQ